MKQLKLDDIVAKWLGQCGQCDAGIGQCTHPTEDYRPVMLDLVREVQELRDVINKSAAERAGKLRFSELSVINEARANRWHSGFPRNNDGWGITDWSNAMCGEAGETANVAKKMRRIETGVSQAEQGDLTNAEMYDALLEHLSKEIGDTIIYADLLATFAGLNLGECVRHAFNQVSEREGFPERL